MAQEGWSPRPGFEWDRYGEGNADVRGRPCSGTSRDRRETHFAREEELCEKVQATLWNQVR